MKNEDKEGFFSLLKNFFGSFINSTMGIENIEGYNDSYQKTTKNSGIFKLQEEKNKKKEEQKLKDLRCNQIIEAFNSYYKNKDEDEFIK